MKIGILGAGYIGRAVAKLAIEAGHELMISNSRDPETLFSLKTTLGCRIGTAKEAADFGEMVLVAIPFKNYKAVPEKELAGKIVIDTTNYYPERDGLIADLEERRTCTTEMLATHLKNSIVIKAFNAITAANLEAGNRFTPRNKRRALPIAGDSLAGKRKVAELIIQFGFEVVDAGSLADSWRFERDKPAYCVAFSDMELLEALNAAQRNIDSPYRERRSR